MDLGLTDKKALITASGRGIGMAVAIHLAREGACVTVVSRTEKDVKSVVDKMGGKASGHLGFSLDLAEHDGPSLLIQQLKQTGFWPLDISVHNLGGDMLIKDPFCSIENWRRVYRINFEVAVELNLAIVPEMQKQKFGRIIHTSSIAAMENQGSVPYCAMKAALTAYTRSFGGVVAPDGVVISAILPGAVITEGGYWDEARKNRPNHVAKFLGERQRIGRFGTSDEIADYVTFLCSERASFNTGSIIPIDGGQGRGYFGQ